MKGAIRWGPHDMKVSTTHVRNKKDGKIIKTVITYWDWYFDEDEDEEKMVPMSIMQKVVEPLGFTIEG